MGCYGIRDLRRLFYLFYGYFSVLVKLAILLIFPIGAFILPLFKTKRRLCSYARFPYTKNKR